MIIFSGVMDWKQLLFGDPIRQPEVFIEEV